jgi:hypothetical protein
MDPFTFYTFFIFGVTVLLSALQSRFKIVREYPIVFWSMVFFIPVFTMLHGPMENMSITGFHVAIFTLILAYINPQRMSPRVNEGYIYAYTLFHWYLLIMTLIETGITFWLGVVLVISILPTHLIVKAIFQHDRLEYAEKVILYYWFLFTVIFTFIDQVAMGIVHPFMDMHMVSWENTLYALITAIQLYFIAACFSLIFVGIPLFHIERSGGTLSGRWRRATRECRELRKLKLGNFIEYQISMKEFLVITGISICLFALDLASEDFRQPLIFVYTVIFPAVFFYLRLTPKENLEI